MQQKSKCSQGRSLLILENIKYMILSYNMYFESGNTVKIMKQLQLKIQQFRTLQKPSTRIISIRYTRNNRHLTRNLVAAILDSVYFTL